jgi:hypothetical protein
MCRSTASFRAEKFSLGDDLGEMPGGTEVAATRSLANANAVRWP